MTDEGWIKAKEFAEKKLNEKGGMFRDLLAQAYYEGYYKGYWDGREKATEIWHERIDKTFNKR